MPLSPEQDQHVRGSIEDVQRGLNKAKGALENAVVSLDKGDSEGARYALDEAASEIAAAGREARTTNQALAVARERQQP